MKIRCNDKVCIFTPSVTKLDSSFNTGIFTETAGESKLIGLDMCNVQDCTVTFCENLIEFSKKRKIGIFNITSDVFAVFNIMNLDKSAYLFVSELDFEENTRRLIKRKFSFV